MQYTVKDLYMLCQEEIRNGNGNKHIVLSDDNEGNGYHGMFYGFTPVDKDTEGIYDSQFERPEDTIILG